MGLVYKNWCLDALEGSFALNLIILVGATFYVSKSKGNQLPVVENQLVVGYISVSIAFATFIGILVFQLANLTGIDQYLKRKCAAVAIQNQAEAEVGSLDDDSLPDRLVIPEEYAPPFHTQQGHVGPTRRANEVQRRLTSYGSIM